MPGRPPPPGSLQAGRWEDNKPSSARVARACCVAAIAIGSLGMALSGRAEAAEAIRKRIGSGALYSAFVPPTLAHDDSPSSRTRRVERLLWAASVVLLVVVLVLAAVVALGL